MAEAISASGRISIRKVFVRSFMNMVTDLGKYDSTVATLFELSMGRYIDTRDLENSDFLALNKHTASNSDSQPKEAPLNTESSNFKRAA